MSRPPTRRSLREAERRSATSGAQPQVAPPGVSAPGGPTAHQVPSWAHHGPVAPSSRPAHSPAPAPVPRPVPAPVSRPAPAPATEALTAVPQVTAAAPARSAWSTSPRVPATQPAPATAKQAPARAPQAPARAEVAPAPDQSSAARVASPTASRPAPKPDRPVRPRVEDVPELAGVPHGSIRRTPRPTRAAARLGVLGVLAGITVVIPVTQGLVAGPVAFGSDALADSSLPSTVSALAGASLSALPPTSLASTDGALQARGLAAASRAEERSALPGCDGSLRAAGQNGLLRTADLCTLWDNHTQLRADAAVSLAEFNQAFAARFGGDLCLSSGYRTLAAQRSVKAQKGGLAAVPGKSNHGWGLAIDLCQDQTSGVKWRWINENGPAYGWENPAWAQPGGSGPFERWHWEYTKGVQADGEYYDS
ncbi:D-alanyl-D-alanine carboxypeptidase family protein [Cellulomonas fengjieae]|uniref:D-alanyl-D-alanine carboxypeptidase family protein n=1 Tax=Cellulomonas fengjieae TaxID=2819978 RepID=UPI001AAF2058|nr:D-alanyl-D-alanine carboxypeptidase family protein [Cellulomonas fengjieae]MBO3103746.1 D-alanyl-D-alanine carboxypeptidase family protein [Cellulomonas fengjieae]